MKRTALTALILALLAIAGCAGTQPPKPGGLTDASATVGGSLLCQYTIPAAQKAATAQAVSIASQLDDGALYADASNPLGQLATLAPQFYGLAWQGVNEALSAAGVADSVEWQAAARRLFRAFVDGCASGLGAA